MRTLIGVGAALVVLALVAGGLVRWRLDGWLDANRERIARQAEGALGRPVAFDTLGASLRGGIGVRAGGVRVGDDPAYGTDAFVTARTVAVRVKVWPLLRGRVDVADVLLDAPSVRLVRDDHGLNVASLGRSSAPRTGGTSAAGDRDGGAAGLAALLRVARIRVRDGTVRFLDRTVQPPAETVVGDIGLEVTDLALGRAVGLTLGFRPPGATGGGTVTIEGTVGPVDTLERPAPVPFALRTRLDGTRLVVTSTGVVTPAASVPIEAEVLIEPFAIASLAPLVPAIRAQGVSGAVGVRLAVSGPIAAAALPAIRGAVELRDVAVRPSRGGHGVRGLTTTIEVAPDVVTVPATALEVGEWPMEVEATLRRGATARMARLDPVTVRALGGSVVTRGTVDLADAGSPAFDLATVIRGIDVAALVRLTAPDARVVATGRIDADCTVAGSGGAGPTVRRTLRGGGRIDVRDGALAEVNVAEQVLGGAIGIPGLGTLVPGDVRRKFPQLFGGSETRFERLGTDVTLAGGRATLARTEVAARDYTIRGGGTVGLDGGVRFRGTLTTSELLGREITGRVKELRLATADGGRLTVPFEVRGAWPKVVVTPDLSGLLTAAGAGLLERGMDALGGRDGKKAGTPEDALRKGLKSLFGR